MTLSRAFVVVAGLIVAAPAVAEADCRWSMDRVDAYFAEKAPDAEITSLEGANANRFRAIFNGQDFKRPESDDLLPKVASRIHEARIYWLGPVAYIVMRDGECAPMVAAFERHVAGYLMHRVDPENWPRPERYQSDGT